MSEIYFLAVGLTFALIAMVVLRIWSGWRTWKEWKKARGNDQSGLDDRSASTPRET